MEVQPQSAEPPHMERIVVPQSGAFFASRPQRARPGNGAILAMLITAVVLLVVGTIVLRAIEIIDEPTSHPHTDYDRLIHRLTFAGQVLISVGVVMFALLGWIMAILRTDMPERVRQSALIAPAIIMAAWLVFFMLSML